ncbi:hypothetical protein ACJROX_26785 [Pseudalkalibacillus sp. A8]|uniref:hypothetical protein n=1 Tax=Pseudalkalibacillus sp. A8 TaxID=3382641 RepID=UPI0038B563F4
MKKVLLVSLVVLGFVMIANFNMGDNSLLQRKEEPTVHNPIPNTVYEEEKNDLKDAVKSHLTQLEPDIYAVYQGEKLRLTAMESEVKESMNYKDIAFKVSYHILYGKEINY